MWLLGVAVTVGFSLALFAPFYILICWTLMLSYYQGFWTMGGIRFDPNDLMIAFVALALLLRGRSMKRESKKVPYLIPWLLLGMFLSVSYLLAPQNQDNLTDPFRIGYQLYRYCWKPLIYYPLVVVLVRDVHRLTVFRNCLIAGVGLCGVNAVYQGYNGWDVSSGPFGHGNALASVVLTPLVLCCVLGAFGSSLPQRAVFLLAAGVLARGLLFSQSRAGLASLVLSLGFFGFWSFFLQSGRKRLVQIVPLAILGVLVLIALNPDILQRKSVQHAMSVTDGTKASTMQWRMVERWPHFIGLAMTKPIFGTGTAVDLSLGKRANTPHNGYIALAVRFGFPVAFLYIFFGGMAILNGVRAFLAYRITRLKVFAIMSASPMIGIMAHNMIESTITAQVLLQNIFWTLCAFCALARHAPEQITTPEEAQALARVQEVERAVWTGEAVPPPGIGWGESGWADDLWGPGEPVSSPYTAAER